MHGTHKLWLKRHLWVNYEGDECRLAILVYRMRSKEKLQQEANEHKNRRKKRP